MQEAQGYWKELDVWGRRQRKSKLQSKGWEASAVTGGRPGSPKGTEECHFSKTRKFMFSTYEKIVPKSFNLSYLERTGLGFQDSFSDHMTLTNLL